MKYNISAILFLNVIFLYFIYILFINFITKRNCTFLVSILLLSIGLFKCFKSHRISTILYHDITQQETTHHGYFYYATISATSLILLCNEPSASLELMAQLFRPTCAQNHV